MNISFSLTTAQVRARTKFVTRRLGWKKLKVGQILEACEKCQGLKKGEHPVKLGKIRVKSVRRERLDALADITKPSYGLSELVKEGFLEMRIFDFISMFCAVNKCKPSTVVTRIEFEYL